MIGVPAYLESWMSRQRWFAGKSQKPQLQIVGWFGLADPHRLALIRVYLILDRADKPILYQVPLTERSQPVPAAHGGLIASIGTDTDRRYLYDGPHDPAFAEALLRLIQNGGRAEQGGEPTALDSGSSGGAAVAAVVARGERTGPMPPLRYRSSRVLSGEQSNTSIVFQTISDSPTSGTPKDSPEIVCKIFRALHHGENPDVILTEALAAAESTVAPWPIGHVTGTWDDGSVPGGLATGHLAFAQEFLVGAEDAWRVAVRAAELGDDFSPSAHWLGATTAVMHETLRRALPSRATGRSDIATMVSSMRERFEVATAVVPGLAENRSALEHLYRSATASRWPPLQRIHGDFHLGQVLAVPDRGWVVLDFEGEPLRPMTERTLPDIPLRDIAAMLRSFDYVAGSVSLRSPARTAAVTAWAASCRAAFTAGYASRSGNFLAEHRALLNLFEIDKALYEAHYEAGNRPDWLAIPTRAITALLAASKPNRRR